MIPNEIIDLILLKLNNIMIAYELNSIYAIKKLKQNSQVVVYKNTKFMVFTIVVPVFLSASGSPIYNWNFPITSGTAGQVLISGGGLMSVMIWNTHIICT